MDFYTIYLNLCAKADISPTKAATDMKISTPAVTKWKNGSMPNDVTLMKIANYFGVSMEYLKTGDQAETKKDQPVENDRSVNVKKQLIEIFDNLPEEKLEALLTLIKSNEQ